MIDTQPNRTSTDARKFDSIDEELRRKLVGKRVIVKPLDSPYQKDLPAGKVVSLVLVRERQSVDFLIELERPVFHMLFLTRYYSRCRYVLFEPVYDLKRLLLFADGRDIAEESREKQPDKYRQVPPQHWLSGHMGFVGRRDLITEVVEGLDTKAVTYYGEGRLELLPPDGSPEPG